MAPNMNTGRLQNFMTELRIHDALDMVIDSALAFDFVLIGNLSNVTFIILTLIYSFNLTLKVSFRHGLKLFFA